MTRQHDVPVKAPSALTRTVASLRQPLTTSAIFLAVVVGLGNLLPLSEDLARWRSLLALVVLLLVLGMVATHFAGRPRPRAPVVVRAPLTGEWRAVSSPATKVPSHGTHLFAQTWAIDLVDARDSVDMSLLGRPRLPEDFAGFAMPVRAGVIGQVVSVHDKARDHRSRDSWASLPLLLVENLVRGLIGHRGTFGNFVTIEASDGRYIAYAHLRRESIRVRPGDDVSPDTLIGECGNSGASSQPHVHIQAMDCSSLRTAVGVPIAFETKTFTGVPARGEVM